MRRKVLAAAIVIAATAATPSVLLGDVTDRDEDANVPHQGPMLPAQNADEPRWHFRIADPADLDAVAAEAIYERLREDLAGRYGLSFQRDVEQYQSWRRANTAPYRSMTHGQRFVNNYANAVGRDYTRFEEAGTLPVGSVLAKDSFGVTEDGEVLLGPLFVMEKMADGFRPASGNWRYTMILPDGSLFGTTNGDGDARVEFCIACHLAAERHDHLFFLPDAYRVDPAG